MLKKVRVLPCAAMWEQVRTSPRCLDMAYAHEAEAVCRISDDASKGGSALLALRHYGRFEFKAGARAPEKRLGRLRCFECSKPP